MEPDETASEATDITDTTGQLSSEDKNSDAAEPSTGASISTGSTGAAEKRKAESNNDDEDDDEEQRNTSANIEQGTGGQGCSELDDFDVSQNSQEESSIELHVQMEKQNEAQLKAKRLRKNAAARELYAEKKASAKCSDQNALQNLAMVAREYFQDRVDVHSPLPPPPAVGSTDPDQLFLSSLLADFKAVPAYKKAQTKVNLITLLENAKSTDPNISLSTLLEEEYVPKSPDFSALIDKNIFAGPMFSTPAQPQAKAQTQLQARMFPVSHAAHSVGQNVIVDNNDQRTDASFLFASPSPVGPQAQSVPDMSSPAHNVPVHIISQKSGVSQVLQPRQ